MRNENQFEEKIIPEAYIAVKNLRQEVFNNNIVYLPNQVEFEIELFNPLNEKVLAILTLNGKRESSGIILKPGQRYFLDRFLNENKKFLFDVYQVEAKNSVVERAIEDNGKIKIEFYKEKEKNIIPFEDKQILFSLFIDTKETGRVEKGSVSQQKFKTVDFDAERNSFITIEYRLLPISEKIFCSQCGKRIEGIRDKYCSICGTYLL